MVLPTQIEGSFQVRDLSIPEGKLDPLVQAKLNAVAGNASRITANAGENIAQGQLVYISADDEVKIADRTVPGKEKPVGVATASVLSGNPVQAQQDSSFNVLMEDGLTLNAGDKVRLGTNGKATNTLPIGIEVVTVVGRVLDASGYTGLNSSALIALQIEEPLDVQP